MLLKDIEKNFPYVSVVAYGGNEYGGIVSNQDAYVTTMFVFNKIKTDAEKKIFLEVGDIWWWESNRMIPINIFLKKEMDQFNYCMMTMNTKDVKISVGPCVNINNLSSKRIKRKSVQVLRKR